MPISGTELHNLARYFFERSQSEVLGWQILLEAMTGCRTSEILKLRWDAKHRGEAGFIEGDWLWISRSKGGVKPFCQIHPALKETLRWLKAWRNARHPESPWFLPSSRKTNGAPRKNRVTGILPVALKSLTHALADAGKKVAGAKRTSHGLRAFYVTVRRSQGITDAQIADEIGDKSGASIITSTYGAVPPNWRGAAKLSWMPGKGCKPAWESLGGMPSGMRTVLSKNGKQ
jgi:integrase